MFLSVARSLGLVLLLVAGNATSASAWWDRCNCRPYGYFAPPPAYVYDHTAGPTWTPNGWSYPPVGIVYYPAPVPPPYYAPAYRTTYGLPPPHVPPPRTVQPLK